MTFIVKAMVIVKGSIEFTKLLIKNNFRRKKIVQRAFFAAGRQNYFFAKKKGNPQTLTYIYTSNLLIHTIWITLESNIYFLVFLKFHVKTLKKWQK